MLVQKNDTPAHERILDSFRRFSATIEAYGGIAREIRGDAIVAEFDRTEDTITALSRTRWHNVTSRNSTFVYKNTSPDVREVARALDVDYVLEGSVRKSGDHSRITAQLIEANSGNHVWADRYNRSLDDEFAIQDEIAQTLLVKSYGLSP